MQALRVTPLRLVLLVILLLLGGTAAQTPVVTVSGQQTNANTIAWFFTNNSPTPQRIFASFTAAAPGLTFTPNTQDPNGVPYAEFILAGACQCSILF
jgi:hypothetical protein